MSIVRPLVRPLVSPVVTAVVGAGDEAGSSIPPNTIYLDGGVVPITLDDGTTYVELDP